MINIFYVPVFLLKHWTPLGTYLTTHIFVINNNIGNNINNNILVMIGV